MVTTPIKKRTEHSDQSLFIQWCDRNGFYTGHSKYIEGKEYRGIVHTTPNAGERSAETVKYFKEEGMLSGVADVTVKMPNGVIEFEFKTDKGKQSPKQKDYQQICNSCGIPYYVVRNSFEAVNILKSLLTQ